MASTKILNAKKEVVNEIADKIKNSESVVLFSYQGLTVADMAELRNKVKEANGEVKIYKNTLVSAGGLAVIVHDSGYPCEQTCLGRVTRRGSLSVKKFSYCVGILFKGCLEFLLVKYEFAVISVA